MSNKLNATIFTYGQFTETANIRNQNKKNEVVVDLLEKSLNEPTILFDAGNSDGLRLYQILEALSESAKRNIIQIYGIEYNTEAVEQAVKLFSGSQYKFSPIINRIEDTDFNLIGNIHSREAAKKTILGLENIFLNFNGLGFMHEQGLTGFLSRITSPGDEIITEIHNRIIEQNYIENVEEIFKQYIKRTGLEDLLDGELGAEYTEEGKRIYIKPNKTQIEFQGIKIDISKKDNPNEAEKIYIVFSGAVPYTRMYEFLTFNFANNIYVETRSDLVYTENDSIIRFKRFEHDAWIEDAKEKSKSFTYRDYKIKGFLPYMILNKLTPHHYKSYFYNGTQVNGIPKGPLRTLETEISFRPRTVFPPTSSEKLQLVER